MNGNDEGIKGSLDYQMLLEFNRRKGLIDNILEIIKDKIYIFNKYYILSGIIATTSLDHFTCFLINFYDNKYSLEKRKDYYYDSIIYEHDIKTINNLKEKLSSINPYLCLYIL